MNFNRLLASAAAFMAISGPAAADLTRSEAVPFAGNWQIAWPEDEGVIVNVPDTTCEAPAIIEVVDTYTIHVATPGGDMGNWDVKSFDGRFPWWREDGAALVAEWVRDDAFLLAGKDYTGITTDWANAKQWTRCAMPADGGGVPEAPGEAAGAPE